MSVLLLFVVLLLVGCAKPPEQTYYHPKTGRTNFTAQISECGVLASKFENINMSPIQQYPMADRNDHFQREKVFRYCMHKNGYSEGNSPALAINATNARVNSSNTTLAAGEAALVTITFSRAVGDLEDSDLTVASRVPVES